MRGRAGARESVNSARNRAGAGAVAGMIPFGAGELFGGNSPGILRVLLWVAPAAPEKRQEPRSPRGVGLLGYC
ncbi:hypothetical protein GCM10010469_21620 [Streptomyces labedae]|uniref:Uncharacterized protein n=1 Tax=Streptomyces labedae TaxID=285569 RepID=A0ABP6QU91_9ACTN